MKRLRAILLLVPVLASCSDGPPLHRNEPSPPVPSDTVRLAWRVPQGESLAFAASTDRVPQFTGATVTLRGLVPGVASIEFMDKDGKLRVEGRIDETGMVRVPLVTQESADYQLFLGLLLLLPSAHLRPESPKMEKIEFPAEGPVLMWGEVEHSLGTEVQFLERTCRIIESQFMVELANRQDGRRLGRVKARRVARYDVEGHRCLAVELRVKASYKDPDAVDSAPESTILLRARM